MQNFRNLTEVLRAASTSRNGLWLPRAGADLRALQAHFASYAELTQRALGYAAALQERGLKRSARVAFAISAADELAALILAALQIGAVPVIFPVPVAKRELATFSQVLAAGMAQADAEVLVTSRRLLEHLHSDQLLVGSRVRAMHVGELDAKPALPQATPAAVLHSDLAILEWSADGVAAYSHAEWLDLLERTAQQLGLRSEDVLVSWSAPNESAGLKLLLSGLYTGCTLAFIPPVTLLKHPQAGLLSVSELKATVLVAPTGAYERCLRHEADATVELGRLRVLAATREALPASVQSALVHKLAVKGLRAAALQPSAFLPAHRRMSRGVLSEGQKALWYLAQLAPDSRAYNVPLCLRIRSAVDLAALERALVACVERHAELRSMFPAHEGTPVREVSAHIPAWLETIDVSADSGEALQRRLDDLAAHRFDVERGPLFLARLLRRGPQETILLFVAHHLCVDTISFLTLLSDLAALYPALAHGEAMPLLPPAAASYDDFIAWQRELLAGAAGQTLRAYWKAQLAGVPAAIDLPVDHARPAQQSYRGARLQTALPQALVQGLRALAEREHTTLYTVLLAGLNALLFQESRQRDVVVGTPVVGRSRADFASVVGYFVNTLPIRSQLSAASTFSALVRATRDSVLAALDHQDLPFAQIVEQAGLARDPSRAPLCQVMFQHQTHRAEEQLHDFMRVLTLGGRGELAGLTLEHVPVDQAIAQCDLRLDLREFEDDVAGFWEYSSDLFDASRVERWNTAWLQLLAAAVAQPEMTIADAPDMAAIEAWNDTYHEYPKGNVPLAIACAALETPDAPALRFGAQELSYRELATRTDRVAAALRACGVGRDVLVAVCMERSIELVIALLGTLKAGGAYVPLEPGHPTERLSVMLQDIQPALVIADDDRRATLSTLGAAAIMDATELARIAQDAQYDGAQPLAAIEPSDLAYVIYTSGSTGQPKGVCCQHDGLWNRLCWMQSAYGLSASDRVLQKTPYSFDVSVWEFFWPLMTGACLVIARPGGHKDSAYLLEEIAEQRITTLHFVPSMLQAFVDEASVLPAESSLKRVFCSGEALPYPLMERFMALLPAVELHNLYGPTEASIDVTAWKCEAHPRKLVPIGKPIANTQIYLLDDQQRPVPIGETGELYIGGIGLARGYHRRPELTRERFILNPVPGATSPRLYKTGDLARYDEQGNIEYLGRNDQQIKLRGFRIELGEIEAVLCEHPSVRQGIVAVRELAGGAKRIEAFVVWAANGDHDAVRAWLRSRLPEYMLPAELHDVVALPLTHSGKADRRALLAQLEAPKPRQIVAPRTHIEQVLAAAFGAVLGLRELSIHDNFFDLGGDSIRSLQVRAHARRRGVLFDTAQLLQHQTIAALAQVLTLAEPEQEHALAPFVLLTAAERAALTADDYAQYEDAFPTTRLQLGMLYHSRLTSDSWAYLDTLSFELDLDQPLSEAALRGALAAVVRCHAMLRASFELGRFGRPLTLIARSVSTPLTWTDLRELSAAQATQRMAEQIEHERRRGYQIDRAPLFRLNVQLLAASHARITLSFHHAIMDGWSAATLQHDLLREYLRLTTHPELPASAPPEHSFAAFVELEAQALQHDASRAYWASALADHELVPLPRWPEQHAGGRDASRLLRPLPEALRAALMRCAAELHASPKHLLLAAHVRVLAAFTGSERVCSGLITHGRPELSDSERIIGLFLNTLPLCVELDHSSWAELVARLASQEQALFEHRRYPLHEIQRVAGTQKLFDVAFNYVSFHLYHDVLATGALRMSAFEVHENTDFAALANFVDDPRTGALALHLEFDTQRVAAQQAEQLADAYLLAIEALVADVSRAARASSVLSPEEQQRLQAWERGQAAPATHGRVHAYFEHTRARTPEAIAVQYEDTQLSYEQLGAWSDGVAARLLESGALDGEVIAICAEPGLPRTAAVLGVLKAGCAYLPLDPSFPRERLAYMLERASVKRCLVTPTHRAAAFLAKVECLDPCEHRSGALPAQLPAASGDAPAYVIYTSGSTGRPKGILMTHAPLSNLIAWQCAQSSATPRDATAHYSAFSFDVSFQELFSTWASGGRVVIVPEHSRKDTRALLKLLRQERVARLFVPVVVLHQLTAVAEELSIALPELREIITAGEQLEITAEVRAFFLRHPLCRLENQYGPTETHVATAYALPRDPALWPLAPAIGRPLPGVRAYVLDDTRARVPVGVPGELFLAGACVAAGYVGDELLSAERFLQDAYEPGARMYTTGDRVRWLPDGTLEYLGRRDSQVKVRGYRVELAEVEAALVAAGKGDITRAVVVAPAGRQQLHAYLTCKGDTTWDAHALKRELARMLPEPMVPALIVRLDALPLTPTGKVDRRALAQQLHEPAPVVRIHKRPQDELERELCQLWEEVLGVTAGTDLDFFEAGGESLRAVRLMARIQRDYHVELPISALIEAPTVQDFAVTLRAAMGGAARAQGRLVQLLAPRPGEPAWFLIHPIGGNVLCYMPLARRLGRGCYGLQARGLDGRAAPHTAVADMAREYVAELTAQQPCGVIHLAGWSFGGYVAVEVADQLRKAGREVAPIVIMDTIAALRWHAELNDSDILEFMAMELLGTRADDQLLESLATDEASAQKLERVSDFARAQGVGLAARDAAQLAHVQKIIETNFRAVYQHTPPRYDGAVVLLRCTDPMPGRLRRLHDLFGSVYHAADNGWGAYCSNLQVIPVRGNHLNLVSEPHVAQVTEVLNRCAQGLPPVAKPVPVSA